MKYLIVFALSLSFLTLNLEASSYQRPSPSRQNYTMERVWYLPTQQVINSHCERCSPTRVNHDFENVWYITKEPAVPHECEICSDDDIDPFEPFNRGVYTINCILDHVLLEPIAVAYKEIFPEFVRTRVSYILRNLSEPIVLANNLLQGNAHDAEDTLRRFLMNSTVGLAGIFDVSTDYGIPYKREDFGTTLASWGTAPGPYLVLPILGPSCVRDGAGRAVDYCLDPINWATYGMGGSYYSHGRTSSQIVDAKTDILEITQDIKENSVDPYAASRAWYFEYRKSLIEKKKCGKQEAIDTPRPDDDD